MSRTSVLLILGVLIVLSPFVGLPLSILAWVLPVLGFCVIAVGASLRIKRTAVPLAPRPYDSPASPHQ